MKKYLKIRDLFYEILEESFGSWLVTTINGSELLIEKEEFEKINETTYEYVGLGSPTVLQRMVG